MTLDGTHTPGIALRLSNATPAAKVIQIVQVKFLRGDGTTDKPMRRVTGYYDFDGRLLAEYDPHTSPAHIGGNR